MSKANAKVAGYGLGLVFLVGVGMVSFFHYTTDNWKRSVEYAGGLLGALLLCLILVFMLSSALERGANRRGEDSDMARRIGPGSWILFPICSLLGSVCLGGALLSNEADWRLNIALGVALLCVSLLAISGLLTRISRAVARTLPSGTGMDRYAPVVLIGSAIVLGLLSWSDYNTSSALQRSGIHASATLTGITHHSRSADNYFFHFTLPTGAGETCSTTNVRRGPHRGDAVEIVYDSTDPSNSCESADYGRGYRKIVGEGVLGGLMLVGGAVYWIARRPRINAADAVPTTAGSVAQ